MYPTGVMLLPQSSLGLVLGAGGVRGCAHAGVFEVLEEEGISIDIVVGASIGAMMGLALAAGLPTSYISRVAREAMPMDVFRFYAGRLKATRSNPIGRMLLEAGEGKTFADLEKRFAVVGTDMSSGERCVIDSGPVLPAVQASVALPFIARPVQLNGAHYFDGGIKDTVPVGVARSMGADHVIAVCLGSNFTTPRFVRERAWTHPILRRLGKQRQPISGNVVDVGRFVCRLYLDALEPPRPAADADVLIWPDFGAIGPNSMSGAGFCYEQGVRATREALPTIYEMLTGDGATMTEAGTGMEPRATMAEAGTGMGLHATVAGGGTGMEPRATVGRGGRDV